MRTRFLSVFGREQFSAPLRLRSRQPPSPPIRRDTAFPSTLRRRWVHTSCRSSSLPVGVPKLQVRCRLWVAMLHRVLATDTKFHHPPQVLYGSPVGLESLAVLPLPASFFGVGKLRLTPFCSFSFRCYQTKLQILYNLGKQVSRNSPIFGAF